jgi:glycosyltransferase involved in cell wall biosynthesis
MSRRRHVVAFSNGPRARVETMRQDLHRILPNFEHHLVTHESWLELIERFPPFTIAHTAALLGPNTDRRAVYRALALAPTRMLAYDARGDRFHLHPRQPLSSLLFFNGLPVDRIHWRPWRQDPEVAVSPRVYQGHAQRPGQIRVGILSPYLPWPLTHGGAVRIYSLLRECALEANIHLFAFAEEGDDQVDLAPLLEVCASLTILNKPRVRRWRWASLSPVEVHEYESPAMRHAWSDATLDVKQVEFTQLAAYPGDILIEHDVTLDLAAQEAHRAGTLTAAWNHWRWSKFERAAWKRFASIVVMSERDRAQVQHPAVAVLPNGVDLERFAAPAAQAHTPPRLLFVGSFRHFPNALAYRFLIEELWPRFRQQRPDAILEVVAGPRADLYYLFGAIPRPTGVELHGFVSRIEDCYARATLVLIPTPVSAGTNIKALEAMAASRPIVSTPSGVHGLGLIDGESVLVALSAEEFCQACDTLLRDPALRQRLVAKALRLAQERYSWRSIAQDQVSLWNRLAR